MAIYKILNDELLPLTATSFSKASIKEREDLQRLLKKQVDIISPDTLVIEEEFSQGCSILKTLINNQVVKSCYK